MEVNDRFSTKKNLNLRLKTLKNAHKAIHFLKEAFSCTKSESLKSVLQNFRPHFPEVLFLRKTSRFAEHLSLSAVYYKNF